MKTACTNGLTERNLLTEEEINDILNKSTIIQEQHNDDT